MTAGATGDGDGGGCAPAFGTPARLREGGAGGGGGCALTAVPPPLPLRGARPGWEIAGVDAADRSS